MASRFYVFKILLIFVALFVDQFLLQIDDPADTATVSYILQDDNYNVVALTSASGVILRQHAFDPYGSLIARDDFPAFGQTTVPATRLGHQGLMVDRLDAPWDVDLVVAGTSTGHPAGSTASPDATPRLIYLNRNRIYDPLFARFHQRDPNETALPLLGAAVSSGEGFSAPMQMLDVQSAYGDGLNLYGYHGANPINRLDPSGLFAFGGFGDLMGSTAVRASLQALEAGSVIATVLDTFSAIASGMDWRNALLDAAIAAAADRLGGKLFDAAIDGAIAGFRAIKNALDKGGITELGAEAAERVAKRALLASNSLRGRAFEAAAISALGLTKNTRKITWEGVNAIPDVITESQVIEIKDVISISLSPQLKAIGNWARANGKEAVLYVSDRNEYVSGPVKGLFKVLPVAQ